MYPNIYNQTRGKRHEENEQKKRSRNHKEEEEKEKGADQYEYIVRTCVPFPWPKWPAFG